MKTINEMKLSFESKSINEGFSRVAVASFASALDPTLEELNDIKTAVSEAVTNCIIHGYENRGGTIYMDCSSDDEGITISIRDEGRGIEDVELARQPFYTSAAGMDRSGMGFAVMEAFMDRVDVESEVGKGTCVTMRKHISARVEEND